MLLKFLFHLRGQHFNQLDPILNLEGLPNLSRMNDILPNLIMQLPVNLIGLGQSPQGRQLAPHLAGNLIQILQDIANLRNIIGQDQAAQQDNQSQHRSFSSIAHSNIPEADSSHDTGGPVDGVDVLILPAIRIDGVFEQPILALLDQCQSQQQGGCYVHEEEVSEKQADEGYYLPLGIVADENIHDPLHPLHEDDIKDGREVPEHPRHNIRRKGNEHKDVDQQ